MDFFQQYHIVIIGCLFMTAVAAMVFLTWRDKHWIKARFKPDEIIALGFGISCFGLASDSGPPKKHKGFLLVHSNGLLFKTRFSNIRYDIPGSAITKVSQQNSHKGSRLFGAAVSVEFMAEDKTLDTIAFKMAYPPQWVKIIGKAFVKNGKKTTD